MGKLAGEMGRMGLRVGMLTERMEKLAEVQANMQTDVGKLRGFDLERRYRERGPGYFGRIIRRTYVLSGNELRALLDEATAEGQLSEDYAEEHHPDGPGTAQGRRLGGIPGGRGLLGSGA